MKYLVGIGYVNRIDLLSLALASIKPYLSNTVIIDNSSNKELRQAELGFSDTRTYTPPVPLTFSQTMNLLHRFGAEQDCDVILFMHNDAEAADGTAGKFLLAIEELQKEGRNWGVAFTNYHALVAFNMKAVKEAGPWDTILPHYFSDCDYYRRLHLSGYEQVCTGLPVTHHDNGSSTIKSDTRLEEINNKTFPLYEHYYRVKWGGPPGRESFLRPFNQFPLNPAGDYLKPYEKQFNP